MTWSLRTPFTNARRRAWARRAQQPGELLYVAIGDSAAQGVGARDLDASYVGLLAARCSGRPGRTVRVVNLSRYGARLADALDRQLPELAGAAPRPRDGRDRRQRHGRLRRRALRRPVRPVAARCRRTRSSPTCRASTSATANWIPCSPRADRRLVRPAAWPRPAPPGHREAARSASFPEFTWDQFHPLGTRLSGVGVGVCGRGHAGSRGRCSGTRFSGQGADNDGNGRG